MKRGADLRCTTYLNRNRRAPFAVDKLPMFRLLCSSLLLCEATQRWNSAAPSAGILPDL